MENTFIKHAQAYIGTLFGVNNIGEKHTELFRLLLALVHSTIIITSTQLEN